MNTPIVAGRIQPELNRIAQVAHEVRATHGPGGTQDQLRHWKVRSEYGSYVITVSCRYKPQRRRP